MASKRFLPGDLVLVKFPGYGYWPCKITASLKKGLRKIMCFGEYEIGSAYINDMKYYDDTTPKKHISKERLKKYPALAKAVKQISSEFRNGPSGNTSKKQSTPKRQNNRINTNKTGNQMMENIDHINDQMDENSNSIKNAKSTVDNRRVAVEVISNVGEYHEELQGDLEAEAETEVGLVAIRGNTTFIRKTISLTDHAKSNEDSKVKRKCRKINENLNEDSDTDNSPRDKVVFKCEILDHPEGHEMSEITVEESVNKCIGIGKHKQIDKNTMQNTNQSRDRDRSQEQNGMANNQSSSQTSSRNKDSSGADYTNTYTHEPCACRNCHETVKISMTIQMSASTYAKVAPLLATAVNNSQNGEVNQNVEEG